MICAPPPQCRPVWLNSEWCMKDSSVLPEIIYSGIIFRNRNIETLAITHGNLDNPSNCSRILGSQYNWTICFLLHAMLFTDDNCIIYLNEAQRWRGLQMFPEDSRGARVTLVVEFIFNLVIFPVRPAMRTVASFPMSPCTGSYFQ